MNKYCICYY